jgi:hypothetical protein
LKPPHDRPVAGDGANTGGQLERWDEVALDELEVNTGFESDHEMRTGFEQDAQEIKRKIAAIKQVGPTRAPHTLRGCLQIVDFARRGEDELLRYPFNPVKNTRDLGGPGFLAVLCPIVGRSESLIRLAFGSDAREFLTRLLKIGSIMR